MAEVELIGVPFDGYGRPGNQARASAVLREAGLPAAFPGHRVHDTGDLDLPPGTERRGPAGGLINEPAMTVMVAAVRTRVSQAVSRSRLPFVYGGDCTSLLGAVTGLQDAVGDPGLLHVDGHEDTMPLDVSEDGEAANAEIGLLLGLTGRLLEGPLARGLPALDLDRIALLGQRDATWRRQFNVGSLRDLGVFVRRADETAADPAAAAREPVGRITAHAERWWLHIDLDVLDPEVFAAQGLPDFPDEPGGLTWDTLTQSLRSAVGAGGCAGVSLAIYDPDQDEDRTDARRVVALIDDVAAAL